MRSLLPRFMASALAVTLAVTFVVASPSSAATNLLRPVSLTTTAGTTGGQIVNALAVQDQSGSQDGWSKYVEFYAPYAGYRSYNLPVSVTASGITSLQAGVNFRGPSKGEGGQTWTWSVYDWAAAAWVVVGDNSGLPSWKWGAKTMSAPGPFARYVNPTGQIRVRVATANSYDAADLDAEWVNVVSGDAATTTTNPTTTTQRATTTTTTQPATTTTKPTTQRATTTTTTQPATTTTTLPTGSRWIPAPGTPWQWQLTSPVDQTVIVPVYDIDGFDNSAAVVAQLHASGRKAICYLDVGGWENYRPDASQYPASVLGGAMDGWPDERWVDIRQTSLLQPVLEARVKMCADEGFDGVEPDIMAGYQENTGFPLTAADQLNFNRWMAGLVHKYNMSAALKNDPDQAGQLVGSFEFAIVEQCFQYSECTAFNPFVNAGKAVFETEYSVDVSKFCPQANTMRFSAMRKHLALDAWRQPC